MWCDRYVAPTWVQFLSAHCTYLYHTLVAVAMLISLTPPLGRAGCGVQKVQELTRDRQTHDGANSRDRVHSLVRLSRTMRGNERVSGMPSPMFGQCKVAHV